MSNCITTHKDADDVGGNIIAGKKNPYLKASDWGWQIDPLGLRIALNEIYARYEIPLMVVENGMGAYDEVEEDGSIHDPYRIQYLCDHIKQLKMMLDEGLPVLGYCPWSFVDVVSSHQGFAKRYGLVFVDRTDTDPKQCRRVKKDSFYWYQGVIARNGLSDADMAEE